MICQVLAKGSQILRERKVGNGQKSQPKVSVVDDVTASKPKIEMIEVGTVRKISKSLVKKATQPQEVVSYVNDFAPIGPKIVMSLLGIVKNTKDKVLTAAIINALGNCVKNLENHPCLNSIMKREILEFTLKYLRHQDEDLIVIEQALFLLNS